MSWICPHCETAAVIRDDDKKTSALDLETKASLLHFMTIGISCPNPECGRAVITVEQRRYFSVGGKRTLLSADFKIPVIPQSTKQRARTYPDYIPTAVLSDYLEACAIADLSPKASATLARRCLQGMIRDFWSVTGKTNLHQEILAIENLVDPVVWEAILSVKNIGNIGAHMEKDINLIIDVSPEEADLLIEMIEMLLDDWYVARYEKQQKLQRIKEVAAEKAEARKAKRE